MILRMYIFVLTQMKKTGNQLLLDMDSLVLMSGEDSEFDKVIKEGI